MFVATADLRALVRAGLLLQFGAKRETYYQGAEPLRAIVAEVRSHRTPIDPSSLFTPRAD